TRVTPSLRGVPQAVCPGKTWVLHRRYTGREGIPELLTPSCLRSLPPRASHIAASKYLARQREVRSVMRQDCDGCCTEAHQARAKHLHRERFPYPRGVHLPRHDIPEPRQPGQSGSLAEGDL